MAPAYIPVELRCQVREDAGGRCGYCHTPEAYIGMPLEYDHLYPEALGGPTERDNQTRFDRLVAKRQAETITAAELQS